MSNTQENNALASRGLFFSGAQNSATGGRLAFQDHPLTVEFANADIVVPSSGLFPTAGTKVKRIDLNFNSTKGRSGAIIQRIVTFDNADATPSVKNANVFITTGTTAITNFDDGRVGQVIYIVATASITITHDATKINLVGAINYAMTVTDSLTLCMFTTGLWTEIARAVI